MVRSPNQNQDGAQTMTDEMMNLRALLEKTADADLVREMLSFGAHRLIGVGN
jgi:hypothetical protein